MSSRILVKWICFEVIVLCFIRFVEFEIRDDMLDCIRKVDNIEFGGKKIRLIEVSKFFC